MIFSCFYKIVQQRMTTVCVCYHCAVLKQTSTYSDEVSRILAINHKTIPFDIQQETDQVIIALSHIATLYYTSLHMTKSMFSSSSNEYDRIVLKHHARNIQTLACEDVSIKRKRTLLSRLGYIFFSAIISAYVNFYTNTEMLELGSNVVYNNKCLCL